MAYRVVAGRSRYLESHAGGKPAEETICAANGPAFVDKTSHALARVDSYKSQLLHGADYWRTVLDGAVGMDVYGNNGVAAGDFDGDGFDDLVYLPTRRAAEPAVSQPRRRHIRGRDGKGRSWRARRNACALFADFLEPRAAGSAGGVRNRAAALPNNGNGTFLAQRDAFKFTRSASGNVHPCRHCRLRQGRPARRVLLHVHVLPGTRPVPLPDPVLRRSQWSSQLPIPQRGRRNLCRSDRGVRIERRQ